MARASASALPGGTSQPVTPCFTLSGMPPAAVATTAQRCAIASRVTSELPSYSVGCTNSVASAVPLMQVVVRHAAEEMNPAAETTLLRLALQSATPRSVPDEHQMARPCARHGRQSRQRLNQHVEALVRFEAADGEQQARLSLSPSQRACHVSMLAFVPGRQHVDWRRDRLHSGSRAAGPPRRRDAPARPGPARRRSQSPGRPHRNRPAPPPAAAGRPASSTARATDRCPRTPPGPGD